jgi:hypothetical protein
MAQPRPTRIIQPSAKLVSADNVSEIQLKSHQNAVAKARECVNPPLVSVESIPTLPLPSQSTSASATVTIPSDAIESEHDNNATHLFKRRINVVLSDSDHDSDLNKSNTTSSPRRQKSRKKKTKQNSSSQGMFCLLVDMMSCDPDCVQIMSMTVVCIRMSMFRTSITTLPKLRVNR